ncbi:MAG: hypothetical protein LBT81_05080 [Helicobacteraceae bacterium]|jgi:glycine/serine hydroxymethyltransferase|nr:hypothetical protein [Helicobacteraceae bacterium]
MAADGNVVVGITIGALFSGAGAFSTSKKAVDSLGSSIKALKDFKLTLSADSSQLKLADRQIKITTAAMDTLIGRMGRINRLESIQDKAKQRLAGSWRIGVAASATLGFPAKAAIDFESAMADVLNNFNNRD